MEISICNVAVLIVATGLSETMYVFVSSEVRHGISTKVSSVFSATAGTEAFSFISSYAVSGTVAASDNSFVQLNDYTRSLENSNSSDVPKMRGGD